MEYLLAVWPIIAQRLKSARHILLLTDYDGTLTPIADRPELANLTPDTEYLLRKLAKNRRFTVAIISGRALSDLKNRVNINGIIYSGNHGLEIEGPGVGFIEPFAEEMRPVLRVIGQLLRYTLSAIKGVIIEDKGLSLSVHYRQVDESKAEQVRSIFERVAGPAQKLGKIRVTSGKKVFEVRPAVAWDKGKAIGLLLKKYRSVGKRNGLLPIYLGDDRTDEDGFKFLKTLGDGFSILVGEEFQETAADYFLKSPEEVKEFLNILLEHTRRGLK